MTHLAIFIIRLVVCGLYALAFLFPYHKFNVAGKHIRAIKIVMMVIFIGMCVHLFIITATT